MKGAPTPLPALRGSQTSTSADINAYLGMATPKNNQRILILDSEGVNGASKCTVLLKRHNRTGIPLGIIIVIIE